MEANNWRGARRCKGGCDSFGANKDARVQVASDAQRGTHDLRIGLTTAESGLASAVSAIARGDARIVRSLSSVSAMSHDARIVSGGDTEGTTVSGLGKGQHKGVPCTVLEDDIQLHSDRLSELLILMMQCATLGSCSSEALALILDEIATQSRDLNDAKLEYERECTAGPRNNPVIG